MVGSTPLRSINRPRRTDTRRSNTFWQYWCYGNRSVISYRGGRWTFRNWGDIGLYPVSRETTQTNKPAKRLTKTEAITSVVLLRKRRNIPNGSCHHKDPSLTREASPHSTWTRRWQDLEMDGKWEANQQPPWTVCCQNYAIADQPYQPTHTQIHRSH